MVKVGGWGMQLSVLFWVVYIISLLFGGWAYWPVGPDKVRPLGGYLVVMVLIGMLGLEAFGAAVKR